MAKIDLFTPVTIGTLPLPNRVVMAPMTRNRAGEGNAPTALNVEYYVQRASAGLIVTEATQVSPQGVGYPGTPGIHSDQQVAGWRRVTAAVHAAGGRIFLQLWHVGRISHPSLQPNGGLPVAPSAIAAKGEAFTLTGMQPFPTPRALDTDEIADVVRQYADGARRALDAGFDGVEVHGANGYLIDQFLRDGTNQRSDRYGGSIENRTRFLGEVTDAVVAVWGAERVGLRISPRGEFNDMRDSDPAALFTRVAAQVGAKRLAYLHVVEPVGTADALAPRLRAAFGGPLILNGGFDRAAGDAALGAGSGDLVSFGAPFLANPDLPVRFRVGAPLNTPDHATFYGGAAKGYTDYPALDTAAA
jgi:N-ethylmaleimide reductase